MPTGLTYADLARKAGLSRVQVWRIMRGERAPSWDAACKLAAGMGVTLDQLKAVLEKAQGSEELAA